MTFRIYGIGVVALGMVLAGCATVTHPIYGVQEGRLASCDGQAGCVSTQAPAESAHHVAPITFASLRTDARADLVTALRVLGDNRIVSSHRSYLRAEFSYADILDDVEFYLPVDQRVIHIRSATRDGDPDVARHRGRVEALRRSIHDLQERR